MIKIGLGIYQFAEGLYTQTYIEEELVANVTTFIGFIQGNSSVLGVVVLSFAIGIGLLENSLPTPDRRGEPSPGDQIEILF
ncbi:hypothetical protein [Paenibacillus solani]|uniref:Uncharacterized protein n=1 Tax=Paenibacillus solani TaxID=1705565 RepID=A0A0M1P4P6_9BACL|nr:hypothetical protein [Paenibacillus solani]KOR89285.1 hypothetical protein AM231_09095 [Paenibacillus solani]